MASLAKCLARTIVVSKNNCILKGCKKSITTSGKMHSQHWQQEGIPGANMPIGIKSRPLLTLGFFIFLLAGIQSPFLIVLWNIYLQNRQEPVVESALPLEEKTDYCAN